MGAICQAGVREPGCASGVIELCSGMTLGGVSSGLPGPSWATWRAPSPLWASMALSEIQGQPPAGHTSLWAAGQGAASDHSLWPGWEAGVLAGVWEGLFPGQQPLPQPSPSGQSALGLAVEEKRSTDRSLPRRGRKDGAP